jgi:threonine dehydrogenase-like Zn-dependent dehydrogenase
MQLVRPRGTIVLKTMLPPSAIEARPIDFTPMVDNELHIIGSSTGPISEAVALLEAGNVDVVNLISRRMRLDDGPAILQTVAKPETRTVLVDTR